MAAMTNREIAAAARALGHTQLEVRQRPNGRWELACSCGYVSTGRLEFNDAVGAGQIHLRKAAAAFGRNGVSRIPNFTGVV